MPVVPVVLLDAVVVEVQLGVAPLGCRIAATPVDDAPTP